MPVTKIVVLMLENRSFDHMLGMRPGVNGLLREDGTIDPKHFNPLDPTDPTSRRFAVTDDAPFAVDPLDVYKSGASTFGGPSHSFPGATEQLSGDKNGPVEADAPLDGFLKSYLDVLVHSAHRKNPSDDETRLPMQAFGRAQLPVLWALADEFLVCDNWFSEVPGPTQPNRLFVHAGTSMGFTHNVWSHAITAPTIYDKLEAAGKNWAIFYFDLKDSDSFPALKKRVDRILPFTQFFEQAKDGTLPEYTFLCPRYNDAEEGRESSQHAPADVRDGEDLIADVYEALRNGRGWSDTLLIVTYDEHGGFYDHVVPPMVTRPDDFTSPTAFDRQEAARSARNKYLLQPDYAFKFDRLGLRVPTVLVSPHVQKGVDHTPYRHTSILATLHELFGTEPLTERDRDAASFLAKLKGSLRTDTPEHLPRPSVTDAEHNEAAMHSDLRRAPSAAQSEMWPVLTHLDGHRDSGRVTAPPPTRAEASRYVQERVAAHNAHHKPGSHK